MRHLILVQIVVHFLRDPNERTTCALDLVRPESGLCARTHLVICILLLSPLSVVFIVPHCNPPYKRLEVIPGRSVEIYSPSLKRYLIEF